MTITMTLDEYEDLKRRTAGHEREWLRAHRNYEDALEAWAASVGDPKPQRSDARVDENMVAWMTRTHDRLDAWKPKREAA